MRWLRLFGSLTVRSLRSPSLAPSLATTAWSLRRSGWYRRAPFLPLPDRDYIRWRMYTAYGDSTAVPPAHDVERYARWAARSSAR